MSYEDEIRRFDGGNLNRFQDLRGKDLDRIKNSPDADKYLQEAFDAMSPADRKGFFNFLQIDGLPEANEAMRQKVRKAKRKHKRKG